MSVEKQERIKTIASQKWSRHFDDRLGLSPEELLRYYDVDKKQLPAEECFKINEHVIMTIKILEQISFPSHLTKIPEYAGTHHETMTASDRPYKKVKTLSESLQIMSFMAKDEHIDMDVFELFLKSKVYLKYAQAHLKPEQIDEVDITLLL